MMIGGYGQIIRTVQCCIMHRNCIQSQAHSYEQFLQVY